MKKLFLIYLALFGMQVAAIDESVPMVIDKEIRNTQTNKMTRQNLQNWSTRFTDFLEKLPGQQIKNLAELEKNIISCDAALERVKSNFPQATKKQNKEMKDILQAVGAVIETLTSTEDIDGHEDIQNTMFNLHDQMKSGFFGPDVYADYIAVTKAYAKKCQEIYAQEDTLFNMRKSEAKTNANAVDTFVNQVLRLNNDPKNLVALSDAVNIEGHTFVKINILGDGNCFYRAFWSSYLCNAVMQTKEEKEARINKIIQLLNDKFVTNLQGLDNKFLFRKPIKTVIGKSGRQLTVTDENQQAANLEKYQQQITNLKKEDYLGHVKTRLIQILNKIEDLDQGDNQGVIDVMNNNIFDYFMIMFLHTLICGKRDNDNYWCAWATEEAGDIVSRNLGIETLTHTTAQLLANHEIYRKPKGEQAFVLFSGSHFEGLIEKPRVEEAKRV